MKIESNIYGFGKKIYSSNVEYKLSLTGSFYQFYKKGTNICHNEYGPSCELKDGSYIYYINDKYHRLNDYAFYSAKSKCKQYYVIGKYLGNTKEDFIKNIANILITKN